MAESTLLWRYPLAQGSNADEYVHTVQSAYRPSRMRYTGAVPEHMRYEVRALRDAEFTIGFIRNSLDIRVDGSPAGGFYLINLGISGQILSQRGSERIVNCPTIAAVYNPGDDLVLLPRPGGASTLCILLDQTLVERELTLLLGRSPGGPPKFNFALDLSASQSAGLRMVIDSMLAQLDSEHEVLQHPAVRLGQVRSLATTLLVAHRHSYSGALADGHSPPRPRPLRRAMEFIEENLRAPLTLGDIAAAAGCSARTVNDSFREHLSVTPMARVSQLRLDRVHEELLKGSASVSDVAFSWGFTHLGRFAGLYQQRFGELPSETVKRRLAGRHGSQPAKPSLLQVTGASGPGTSPSWASIDSWSK
jgi:AraC-like DNA-binding protein